MKKTEYDQIKEQIETVQDRIATLEQECEDADEEDFEFDCDSQGIEDCEKEIERLNYQIRELVFSQPDKYGHTIEFQRREFYLWAWRIAITKSPASKNFRDFCGAISGCDSDTAIKAALEKHIVPNLGKVWVDEELPN